MSPISRGFRGHRPHAGSARASHRASTSSTTSNLPLELLIEDRPGFWEAAGYHNYGDPWKQQRHQGD